MVFILNSRIVKMKLSPLNLLVTASLTFASTAALATIVELETSHGNIQINLHDSSTPKTVENFLSYVTDGAYTDTVIHRVEPGFVVQGGGFKYDGDTSLAEIPTNPSVENEPKWSNVQGTIAMAKLSNLPDSATSQWFFNMADNSANLDQQNSGFTVFGQVIGDGMDVLNRIQDVPRCGSIPIENYTAENCTNSDVPAYEDFVTIYSATIVDSSTNTDADLTKVENTLINTPTTPTTPDNGNSSGGGSMAWLTILMACLMTRKVWLNK